MLCEGEKSFLPIGFFQAIRKINKSPDGAKSSCGMYTLIETAKQNNIEPLSYLRSLFEKAPFAASPEDWESLLPWNIFKK